MDKAKIKFYGNAKDDKFQDALAVVLAKAILRKIAENHME